MVQIELMPPPKADALAHLDGSGPAPKRYARVTVIRGGHNDCMDYQVGSSWHSRLRKGARQSGSGRCAELLMLSSQHAASPL